MAKNYAKAFYNGASWRKCKNGFMQSKHYLCERCGDIAVICHHKQYITPQNINNPNITLNWDNLEALCQTCHNQEHHSGDICANGLVFDNKGNLIQK
ncbi:HNH endonuclease [Bacillus tropicus]|uniref:HNH endonuclease n=1 Tax=Bacillus tropicus TaxID=2026188 RepID=UPI000B44714C|nr:HNH endonuclease [Bacillus tropicus]MBG9937441.1 HNH endonuclease [Bacillus tropicus]MED2996937.1 HNH endonuclease [Bacillus tropicus]OTY56772.1 HNH endonuclease [Bacillus thuringiensis serovar graciosensis]